MKPNRASSAPAWIEHKQNDWSYTQNHSAFKVCTPKCIFLASWCINSMPLQTGNLAHQKDICPPGLKLQVAAMVVVRLLQMKSWPIQYVHVECVTSKREIATSPRVWGDRWNCIGESLSPPLYKSKTWRRNQKICTCEIEEKELLR